MPDTPPCRVHCISSCHHLSRLIPRKTPACLPPFPCNRQLPSLLSHHAPATLPLSPCKVTYLPTFNLFRPCPALQDNFSFFLLPCTHAARRSHTTFKLAINAKGKKVKRVGTKSGGSFGGSKKKANEWFCFVFKSKIAESSRERVRGVKLSKKGRTSCIKGKGVSGSQKGG